MKLISHRGNINKKNPNLENSPKYIEKAIKLGYDVEIDIWVEKNQLYLGHDYPQYPIQIEWLNFLKSKLWIHCKNLEALSYFYKSTDIRYFWHQNDDYTLTSCKHIWTFPNKLLYYNSICVLPELGYKGDITKCYAICSDYIVKYKKYEK